MFVKSAVSREIHIIMYIRIVLGLVPTFFFLRQCQSKFDCLVFEMLFIKKLKPNLNIQTDSIRAKLFV